MKYEINSLLVSPQGLIDAPRPSLQREQTCWLEMWAEKEKGSPLLIDQGLEAEARWLLCCQYPQRNENLIFQIKSEQGQTESRREAVQ